MKIYKVNLEQEKELAKRFDIRSFPVVLYIKKGKVVAKELGSRTAKELEENVNKYIK